jgi:NAD-dependent SIR2 family protein deacetylase
MTCTNAPARIASITCMEPSFSHDACNATCPSPIWRSTKPLLNFGEMPLDLESIYRELNRATVLLVVGTSGSVYPAAGFVHVANQRGIRTVYVGPEEPLNADAFDEVVLGLATQALPPLLRLPS